jgi:transcription elongation factor Elf1
MNTASTAIKKPEKIEIVNFYCPFCASNAERILVDIIKNNKFKFHCYNCNSTLYLPHHPTKNPLDRNFHYIKNLYFEDPYKLAKISRLKDIHIIKQNGYSKYICPSCNRILKKNPPKRIRKNYHFFKCDSKRCKTHGYIAPRQNLLAFWRLLSKATIVGKAQEKKGLIDGRLPI